ncbi:MAG: M20/M25/M40 family metallo-hydrolase [Gemmatimonadaceae bacterium]
MSRMFRSALPSILFVCSLPLVARAQGDTPPKGKVVPAIRRSLPTPLPLKFEGPSTTADITPLDLATRLYKFADDSMMGRLAGTPWNDKGTDYIAGELKRLGLQPAGENGTYFQQVIVQSELAEGSTLNVDGARFSPWVDFAPRDQGPGAKAFDGASTIFGGTYGDTASYLPASQAEGKTVVVHVGRGKDGTPDYNIINRSQLTVRYQNAAAVAVIYMDYAPPGYVDEAFRQPTPQERGKESGPVVPSYFYITRKIAESVFGVSVDSLKTGMTGKPVQGHYAFEQKAAPGRNVIAVLPGSDPKLKGQYVAIGAHNDHVGFNHTPADHDSVRALMSVAAPLGADSPEPNVTPEQQLQIRHVLDSLRALHPSRPDSIYNGADDDGSGTVSVLEIAEAFAKSKVRPKRSLVFVWHVGEELGLFGSEYFTDHPTIPRDSIVAQLNIDMVGRGKTDDKTGLTKEGQLINGTPGYLQLVGSRRLSTELGDLVEKVNVDKRLGLKFDYAIDANGHPANIYCRSDHYEYARYGIPIVFFTTGLHADYHQVTDEPQYIDYDNMSKIAKLVQQSAIRVANLDHRVVVDKPKPDPKGRCAQ